MNSFLFSLVETAKSFFFSDNKMPESAPFIHDPIDIKRIMTLVVIATLPATFFAILSNGMFATLYEQLNIPLMNEYINASQTISGYFSFLFSHFFTFFIAGCKIFIPQLILIYVTGGIIEIFFASLHRKTVSEGFFVTGILFALIIPPTLPYWMTIFGVSIGLILGKEIFGGTGMNIFNPALICRCILYFSFPSYMTGNIWVGNNQFNVAKNVVQYNVNLKTNSFDTITTATQLNISELPNSVSRLQLDGAALAYTQDVKLKNTLKERLHKFNPNLLIDNLSTTDLINFLTKELYIPEEQLENLAHFAKMTYNIAPYNFANLYFGNMPGSIGETSKFAINLGFLLLLITGLISLRIVVPILLSAFLTALCFYLYASSGVNTPAHYMLSPFKQLFLGGLMFGATFMATDPVSAPTTKMAQIFYGTIIGSLTILIRLINPAFPEGVMLAILFANAFAPLLDRIILRFRKQKIHGTITAGP
ncbi:MAG: Na(+)-translocating NADH-quinone reductase subunit B [Chlamydiia bacterium]|nr:Na(+)-translocating NADH-quinone reductase subunit B [Chlamydiia bacterium]